MMPTMDKNTSSGMSLDKIPFGALMNKGLTVKTGQTHVHRYLQPLLDKIESGEIDPMFVITHTVAVDDTPKMYKTFRDKQRRLRQSSTQASRRLARSFAPRTNSK
jgi:threonine dehydrogenase-like Zn-dependent dehydrogenase